MKHHQSNLKKETQKRYDDYLVLYGSLMQSLDGLKKFNLKNELQFIQPCIFKGALYDLGHYPGFVPGQDEIKGELYRVIDQTVLNTLDIFERFDPNNLKYSLYIRTKILLIEPEHEAWIYRYNQPIDTVERIESGDWYDYLQHSKIKFKAIYIQFERR